MNQTSNDTGEIIMETKTKVWLAEDGKPIIGAGKVALLKAIDEERSLRKACEKLDISYKHAWNVLNKMSERLGKDVVTTIRGGKNQGTFLTEEGRRLISEYEINRKFIDSTMEDEGSWENIGLAISARNKIPARVVSVEKEGLVSRVKLEIEPSALTSIITSEAVERLDIREGDMVYAIIKSTGVLIGKDRTREEGN
jgi:molybdate transport system regulatory protein